MRTPPARRDVRFMRLVRSLVPARGAWLGGGPENVFVVANSRSWASMTIAHHFAALREIPPVNILYLDWPYSTDQVDVAVFREKLLIPILGAIQQRGTSPQIDYIVYSSDFPWSVEFKTFGKPRPPSVRAGRFAYRLTYFSRPLMQDDILSRPSTAIIIRAAEAGMPIFLHAFRGWYGWTQWQADRSRRSPYILTTMLGMTRMRA